MWWLLALLFASAQTPRADTLWSALSLNQHGFVRYPLFYSICRTHLKIQHG